MKKAEKYVPRYAKAPAEGGQRKKDAFYIFLCYFTGLVTGFEFGGYQYIFLDIRMEFGFSNTMMATVNVVQTVVSLCVSLVLSALLDRLNKRRLLYTGAALYSVGTALMLAAALTGCSNTPTANQPQSSQQQAAYISIEQAQETALDAAKIDTADADISSATLSEVAGVTCYKVEFTSGDHAYSYSINAENGEVLEMSSREQSTSAASTDEDTQTVAPSAVPSADTSTAPAQTAPNTNTSTGAVDEAKAQEIALAHAGVSAADATITKSKLDYDDGRQVYEIEWYANGAKYDYEIAVATGEIVNSGYEAKTVVGTGSSATVSKATAKQTALARVSGATEADIYEWKLDYDDGRPEYEGKIIYDGSEYEFTIDATNGTITEWDAEVIHK